MFTCSSLLTFSVGFKRDELMIYEEDFYSIQISKSKEKWRDLSAAGDRGGGRQGRSERREACGSWSAGRGGVGWRASAVADLRNFSKTATSKVVISLSSSRWKPPCSSFRDYENPKILLLKSGLFRNRADSEFWILKIQGFQTGPMPGSIL